MSATDANAGGDSHEESNHKNSEEVPAKVKAGVAGQVASHYNEVPESGIEVRKESRIFFMRNFNNWTKSVLIGEFINLIKNDRPRTINVLDLCCGKGGDLLKWKKAGINHLICADIAGTSVEQCESRYRDNVERSKRERYGPRLFSAEFHVADCTRTRLRDLYRDQNTSLDLVSVQFSFHYCFESYDQTRTMLRNISENLRPGGYFIATTLNSNELVKRWRASDSNSFGNDVYNVKFESDDKENIPLFGAKYLFYLEGSVMDCPEFLVHFPLLVKLADENDLELVYRKPFADYFAESVKRNENRSLLNKMQAMEPYPQVEDRTQVGTSDDYSHARVKLDDLIKDQQPGDENRQPPRLGTLSKAEWEAITLYLVCAFRKKGGPSSTDPHTQESSKRKHGSDEDESGDKKPRPV